MSIEVISRSTWPRKGARPDHCFPASVFRAAMQHILFAAAKPGRKVAFVFSGRTSLDRKIDTFESQVLTFGASVQCSVSKDGCSSAFSPATLWPAQKSS